MHPNYLDAFIKVRAGPRNGWGKGFQVEEMRAGQPDSRLGQTMLGTEPLPCPAPLRVSQGFSPAAFISIHSEKIPK